MAKDMKTRKGKDNIYYPYTSPDIVIDSAGESQTTKNNNMKTDIDTIKTDLGTEELTTNAKNVKGAINEVNKKIGTGTAPTVNSVEPELMDMPRIYFSEGTLPTSKTATVMKFDYYSKTNEYHGYVDIKCQGNSSMSYPKKNFTIKPYKDKAKTTKLKIDFKGWGKQSKFVLKANWIDITHARNVVSARLWGDVIKTRSDYATAIPELLRTSPNQGAIDGFPILVYSNGVYQGRYTLNIPKDKWMSNMDDALDTHCILCGENYKSGCFRELPQINGSDWTDELHDVVPGTIKTSWTNAIKFVMNSTDAEFKANLGNYFDVNSLIDYLLYGIVSTNLDGYGKNQLYFTYDGVHWIASVYDLDSTWGLWWNGGSFVSTTYSRKEFQDHKDGQGNLLYDRLEQLFISQLKSRYIELRKDVLSVSHIIQKFEEFNDVCPKDIAQEDYASTTGDGKFTAIPSKTTNNIQQLRSYINARLTYVDAYINTLQEAIPCTNITLDKTELTITQPVTSTPIEETINTTWTRGALSRSPYSVNQGTPFGNCFNSSNDITTDFIECANSNTFTITTPTPMSTGGGAGIVGYDSSKNAITVYEYRNNEYIWTNGISTDGTSCTISGTNIPIQNIPNNVAYIKICINQSTSNNTTITKTTTTSQEKLIATVTPTNTTDKVVWSVNPTGICTVNNGVVTPIKNGECVVTATCGSHSATCNVTVNLPSVACTSIALDKTALQLGTIEGAQPNTQTNLLEGLTWQDGAINNNGSIIEGTDKYTEVTINIPGVYKLSQSGNYTFTKVIDKPTVVGHPYLINNNDGDEIVFNVFDAPRTFLVSVFPNNQLWNPSLITLNYQNNIKESCTLLDSEQQITDVNLINIRWTDTDYTYVEMFVNSLINQNKLVVKFNNVNYRIANSKTESVGSRDRITNLALDNYTVFNVWQGKTLFYFRLPIAWGSTSEEIMNYMTTNNINKLVINPSDYINTLPTTGTVTKLSQQLVPTVEPSNTTDPIVWSVSPEGIVTADNGLVKAVKNGETVVTATCGTKSATCNVTVSGITTPPSSTLYTLPQETTFNGTSDFIDTGVKLFDTAKDFTIYIDFTSKATNKANSGVFHCVYEKAPYRGLCLNWDTGSNYFLGGQDFSKCNNPYLNKITDGKYLIEFKKGVISRIFNSTGELTINDTAKNNSPYVKVDQNLLLGCYQKTDGTKGRYWNGTINKFNVWFRTLTDEERTVLFQ